MNNRPNIENEYQNLIERNYHKEQAEKFFKCLGRKLKEFNSGLVNGIEDRLETNSLMFDGSSRYYCRKAYLPVYHDADGNNKAGFAVEYNYDSSFGYARIITGIFKEYGKSISPEGLEKILEGKEGLGSPAGKQVDENRWLNSRVFSLKDKNLDTDIAEIDDCIVGLLDTVLEVAEAIRRDPQLKAHMDFVPTNK